eukprot:SAG31_NODE_367_length_16811_cov_20.811584_8_plen_116_part_00
MAIAQLKPIRLSGQSGLSGLLFALCSLLLAPCSLLFALCSLLFALCSLLFALCSLLFALCSGIRTHARVQKEDPDAIELRCADLCQAGRTSTELCNRRNGAIHSERHSWKLCRTA